MTMKSIPSHRCSEFLADDKRAVKRQKPRRHVCQRNYISRNAHKHVFNNKNHITCGVGHIFHYQARETGKQQILNNLWDRAPEVTHTPCAVTVYGRPRHKAYG